MNKYESHHWLRKLSLNESGANDFWQICARGEAVDAGHLHLPLDGNTLDGWFTVTPAKAKELLRLGADMEITAKLNIR